LRKDVNRYFILIPQLDRVHIALFFSFWFFSFILDAWITISNKHLIPYEQNILLPILIQKVGTTPAIMIMFMIEISFMVAMPFLFIRSVNFQTFAVSALAFGTAHLLAFCV
jgi:hypothetical protein